MSKRSILNVLAINEALIRGYYHWPGPSLKCRSMWDVITLGSAFLWVRSCSRVERPTLAGVPTVRFVGVFHPEDRNPRGLVSSSFNSSFSVSRRGSGLASARDKSGAMLELGVGWPLA